MKRIRSLLYLILINIVIFILLLVAVELGFRRFGSDKIEFGPGIYAHLFQPYLMFTTGPTSVQNQATTWNDIYRKVKINAEHKRNNYGFRMDDDVDFVKEYQKQPNERLVIITGGSTVHGVGATKNETNLAAWLEKVLNKKQKQYHYKVLNFGMGSSIAYQEYLALTLWGKWMDPDWIVVMDGHNDIAVCSAHSQGAFYPMFFHHMRSYIDGYLAGQVNPPFYRGWLENQIIKYSFAYRSITKKQYVPRNQYVTYAEGWPRVGTNAKWEDVERQIIFYLHAQELILGLSTRAKYILSLQPVTLSFSDIFSERNGELDAIARANKGKSAGGPQRFYEICLSYFMRRAEEGLKQLVQKYSKELDVQYINMGSYLPEDFVDRKNYLIDNMHVNDLGHELIGTAFAYHILMKDFPAQQQEFAQELTSLLQNAKAASIVNDAAANDIDADTPGIHVIEATYGWNCRDVIPSIGKNKVKKGNATTAIRKVSTGKTRAEIMIDVMMFGDPANGCGKDFYVKWVCNKEKKTYEAYVPGEANQKTVVLTCPVE